MAYIAAADVPAGTAAPSKAGIVALIRDAYSIKAVANTTERAQAATDWPTLTGAAISSTNPVIVWRQDADVIEKSNDGTTFRVYASKNAPKMEIVGGKAGAMPAGAMPIIKVDNVALTTSGSGTGSFTFDSAFPTACASLFVITTGGTAVAASVNLNTISASGATLIWSGVNNTPVTFNYVAFGW